MTTQEKLQHFYDISIESAKDEASSELENYKKTLDRMFEEHKQEKEQQAANQLKVEAENAKREINKALSAEHLHIKRRLSKKQQALRDELFTEVKNMVESFVSTSEYEAWLEAKIREAKELAGDSTLEIFLSPADYGYRESLMARTGLLISMSETPFMGGIIATIPSQNILIDSSFKTLYESAREEFNFDGGMTHE